MSPGVVLVQIGRLNFFMSENLSSQYFVKFIITKQFHRFYFYSPFQAMLWAAKYYVWRSQVAVVVLVLILNLMSSARASPTSSEHSQNEKFSRPLKHKADEVMEARDRIKRGISDEEFSDFVEGTGKMVRPERYSFGLGKRSGGDGKWGRREAGEAGRRVDARFDS